MSGLKDFTVLSKLGEGAFGQVFRVRRGTDSQEYAMKKVKIGAMKEKERENAVNQVRILASLSHEFIVEYKDAFYDEGSGCLCVVMEFAEGGDILKKVNELRRAKSFFPEKEIWHALSNIARGLRHLHRNNILHRDLKCANIFVTKDGVFKLGDLNVSKVLKKGLAHTQTGTPYYASPEVWGDKPYDGRSDMWSLGCVLYEMCALKPPFQAVDLRGLYNKIQAGIFERIPSRYSQELQVIISMLLKVKPELRPTAEQLLTNSIVLKNTGLQEEDEVVNKKLLQTIKFSAKDLKSLQAKLPKSNYEAKEEERPSSGRKERERASSAVGMRREPSLKEIKEAPPPVVLVPKSPLPPTPSSQVKPPQPPPVRQGITPFRPPLPLHQPINMQRAPSPSRPPSQRQRRDSRERELIAQRPKVTQVKDPLELIIKEYERIRLNRENKEREMRGGSRELPRQPSQERMGSRERPQDRSQERGEALRRGSKEVIGEQRMQRVSSSKDVQRNSRPLSAHMRPVWWG